MSDKARDILRAGVQNKELFKKFLTSYLTFFLVPLIVSLMKIYKLVIVLVKNMNPFILDPIHKLIFVIVVFSYLYIAICIFSVLLIAKGIKLNI
jgi:putative effector of murein hydrolase LrgA (UPF0299 family)